MSEDTARTPDKFGLITPPVGLNAFVLESVVPSFSLKEIFGGIWWFLQVEVFTVIMIMFIGDLGTAKLLVV